MTNYYKVMLGQGSQYAQQAIQGGFIGCDDTTAQDLTPLLGLPEPEFRQQSKTLLQAAQQSASKGTISQYATTLWRITVGIQVGDVVICPDGSSGPGQVRVGDVVSGYEYLAGAPLAHRRAVHWRTQPIKRLDMSTELKNSSGGISTIIDLTLYGSELESLSAMLGANPLTPTANAATSVDPMKFDIGKEKELENFLVANWVNTELGQNYDIYQNTISGTGGQQYPTSTGPIDILAISKDKKELLVIELKRGRPSDQVVGQIQRYMGFIQQEVADNQEVRGLIIALEDDLRVRLALLVAPNISFYTYQISFKLNHVSGSQT